MPRTIDLAFTEGPGAGSTAIGIYELNGDDWRICLDVSGNNSSNGTRLQLWDCSGGANQKWNTP